MPYTNLDYLKSFTGDDPELIKEAILRYLKKSPELLSELNQNYENGDWDKVAFTAHTLYSATQIVGLEKIKTELKEIELKAKGEPDSEYIKTRLNTVNEAMAASFEELNMYK